MTWTLTGGIPKSGGLSAWLVVLASNVVTPTESLYVDVLVRMMDGT